MKLTRRPCVSLTRPRKLQFHWKGSADATYQSFAAATVTVRHHESKITRNQGCFSRYMKNVALRIADRLQFFLSADTSRDFIAFSFFFFFFFLATDANVTLEKRNSSDENGLTIVWSQEERTGWKLSRCRC